MTGAETNVALIGYGFAGEIFHAPLIAATPGLRLHSIVSSRSEQIRNAFPDAQICGDPQAVFGDPAISLVVVATPNTSHADLARRALAAGKHVVVDKPFTITLAEAKDVVALAETSGRLLSVFHNRRWDADFLTLRGLVVAGTLGEVIQFESHYDRFRPAVRDRWRERAEPGAGTWYDLGAHLVDQALQLFGMPLAVFADLTQQRDGAVATDYFHVVLRYERLRVILHSCSLASASELRFVAHGTSASYIKTGFDMQEAALKDGLKPDSTGWGVDTCSGMLITMGETETSKQPVANHPGDYPAFYHAMRDAIQTGATLPVLPAEALAVMAVLEGGIASARAGREVSFGQSSH